MIYLRSVRLDKEELPAGFPFDIPCIRTLESLDFTHPLTFFVGENGCGKSTLLEAIACGMQTPAIGSADVSQDPSLEAQRQLARHLKFTRNTNPRIKLFFRAEDSFGFTRKIQGMLEEFSAMEGEFEAEIKGEYGLQLAKGVVQGQAKSLEQKYGENPDGRSHGESFLLFLKERIHPKGLYLLDEPETPLSPIHQMTLMVFLHQQIEEGCQFLIATHSPMLMAFPGAQILSLDQNPIRQLEWEDVEHVRLMKLTLESWGGGPGLVDGETDLAQKAGIEIRYSARVLSLIHSESGVNGVKVKMEGKTHEIKSRAVVLACGGFESNTEWRTRYLGPGWEMAKVRGTCFNTGDGIRMALEVGASPYGNWSGCHAVGWDYNAPEFGDLAVGDGFQKHSYPFGIMVNATGRRFVDEGADFRNYTYAKYGRVILEQPDQFAWQVFDQKVTHLLRDEYRIRRVSKVTGQTLADLADKMEGVDKQGFLDEIQHYNNAVQRGIKFDPNVKDGRGTTGLEINKSNWANTLDEGPFEAYHITCGITFTFGGIRVDPKTSQVINDDLEPIQGLYAAGELVGGLFYFNYPGGTGLMSGSVFGRQAGNSAGKL